MSETTYETDAFLKLLTDALRAGPGSPQWHEAVTQLKTANPAEADEYRLLIAARENLEAGLEYRSVRAGPGFTRKVMDQIEQEAKETGTSGMPSANIVAILAAMGILAVVVVVVVMLSRTPPATPGLAELQATTFATPLVAGDFQTSIPAEWKQFGVAPTISIKEKGLRGTLKDPKESRGGGVHTANPLSSDQPFELSTTISIAKASNSVVLHLFVTEDPSFNNAQATSSREFAVQLREGTLNVYKPDGTIAGEQLRLPDGRSTVQVKMRGPHAVVIANDKVLYAGESGLSPKTQRWPGVRFLTKGNEKSMDDVTVPRAQVLKP
jgi:hypothetical protein